MGSKDGQGCCPTKRCERKSAGVGGHRQKLDQYFRRLRRHGAIAEKGKLNLAIPLFARALSLSHSLSVVSLSLFFFYSFSYSFTSQSRCRWRFSRKHNPLPAGVYHPVLPAAVILQPFAERPAKVLTDKYRNT